MEAGPHHPWVLPGSGTVSKDMDDGGTLDLSLSLSRVSADRGSNLLQLGTKLTGGGSRNRTGDLSGWNGRLAPPKAAGLSDLPMTQACEVVGNWRV